MAEPASNSLPSPNLWRPKHWRRRAAGPHAGAPKQGVAGAAALAAAHDPAGHRAAFALVAGLAFYLTGGRYISTDNAYLGAQKVLITPDISGRVGRVLVREGQHVAAGDALFEIDPVPFRLAVTQAQSKLDSVRTDFANLKSNYQSLSHLVELAKKNVELKQHDVDRKSTLLASRASRQADVDTATAGLVTAQLQSQLAAQQRSGVLDQLLGNPELPIEEFPPYLLAQAALDQAKRDLDHAVVKAPIAGIATQVDNIQLGRFATAGMPVFSIIDDSAPWVDANPKETDITWLRVGQKVDVAVDSFPDRTFRGTVASVSPGTGAQFAILPPQNASGNWVKVGAARAGPHHVRQGPGPVAAARRDERHGGHRHRPAALARRAVRRDAQHRQGGAAVTAAAGAPAPGMRRVMLTVCAMSATIMQALDTTIANVALPYMQGSLSASLDQVNWVLTSYIVASAIMTAPIGWVADRFGRKKLFLICVAGFTVASMLCGLSQNIARWCVPPAAGRFRRRAGAAVAVRDARCLSARGARLRHGDLGHRRDARADHGTDARRLADRQLQLALGVLHQPAGRHPDRRRADVFMDETERQAERASTGSASCPSRSAIGSLQMMLDRGEQVGWFDLSEIVIEAVIAASRSITSWRIR